MNPAYIRHYRHVNLNRAQYEALEGLLSRYTDRPTFKEYVREERVLLKIRATKPTANIPGTLPGTGEKWPAPKVRLGAEEPQIPPGMGLISLGDSGGNTAVHNAASLLWMSWWNNWEGLGLAGRQTLLAQSWRPDHATQTH